MQKNHFKIGVIVIILVWAAFFQDAEAPASGKRSDFKVIIGEWVRPDGGYTLRIRDINPDGSVDAGYFNPRKMNVAEANVSLCKGFVKLFIKLQDRGYPGSTYSLYYYPEKDALAGFYYQAAIGKTFEVVFLRKKVE